MREAPSEAGVARGLHALRRRLDARAAGAWKVEGDRLVRLGFDAAGDMEDSVASGFASATTSVPLDRRDLGIVAAVAEGRREVSLAAGLPADAGSGYWLRAFGADRSVAVPISGEGGSILGVVSVALAGSGPGDEDVEAILREESAGWFGAGRVLD
jgi:hypothetical protein